MHGNLHGFIVTDFTNHNNVGILAEERTEAVCKSDPRFRIDLCLVHARKLVFDRVLDGGDVDRRRIQNMEHRIERRCLAVSCRARHEDHPVRFLYFVVENDDALIRHAEVLERERARRAFEEAHLDFFPVEDGHDVHAHIKV